MSCLVAQDAEPVDDLVGDKIDMGTVRLAMFGVVVTLATLDVVGQRLRNGAALAIPVNKISDMIADHATKPSDLISLVFDVVADIRRCCYTDLECIRVTARFLGRLTYRSDHPLADDRISQLQDHAVGLAATKM